jgi:hypothetical protein
MKNKTPKPRVMWANRLNMPKDAEIKLWSRAQPYARNALLRVAIIPLDDVAAIVERACNAYWRKAGRAAWGHFVYRDGICAALTAAGIPCLKRKARK